jgi:hypothetical protein
VRVRPCLVGLNKDGHSDHVGVRDTSWPTEAILLSDVNHRTKHPETTPGRGCARNCPTLLGSVDLSRRFQLPTVENTLGFSLFSKFVRVDSFCTQPLKTPFDNEIAKATLPSKRRG